MLSVNKKYPLAFKEGTALLLVPKILHLTNSLYRSTKPSTTHFLIKLGKTMGKNMAQ